MRISAGRSKKRKTWGSTQSSEVSLTDWKRAVNGDPGKTELAGVDRGEDHGDPGKVALDGVENREPGKVGLVGVENREPGKVGLVGVDGIDMREPGKVALVGVTGGVAAY